MPFFGASRQPEPVPEPEPTTRRSMFSRREPEPAPVTHDVPQKKHSLFNRRTSSPSPPPAGRGSLSSNSSAGHTRHSKTGSILSRFGGGNEVDPSIQAARERVAGAEAAEAEADRALGAARLRVREAREQVKMLEEEAREDARRAKVKQHQAKDISKRGQGLGRHGL